MKKNLSAFMSGVLATTLVFGIGTSALAASGKLTITVDPINIQVNGQTFAPKDANGKPVDVFAYNGTTYAPLRALAEAYGLEVGYDAKTNMATVVDPKAPTNTTAPSTDYSEWSAEEEAAYQEFKGMWEVGGKRGFEEEGFNYYIYYIGSTPIERMWSNFNDIKSVYARLALEYYPGSGKQFSVFYDGKDTTRSYVVNINADGSVEYVWHSAY